MKQCIHIVHYSKEEEIIATGFENVQRFIQFTYLRLPQIYQQHIRLYIKQWEQKISK